MKQDVMPITGYFGPYAHKYSQFPDYITDECFQMIADSGINLIVYSITDYASNPEAVEKYLELGEKYGIGVFVTDNQVLGKMEQETITVEEVAKEVAKYSGRKAFRGMYLVDEPRIDYFMPGDGSRWLPKYKRLAEILQKDLDILCYDNLFPIVNMEVNRENYERYVEECCDTLQPKVLMWDYYPFDEWREGKMEVCFYNMDLIRKTARERNIPFWAYVQAGSQWNDDWKYFDSKTPYYPNEPQFDWIVNVSLAFGAQGIQYFPLIQPYQFTFAESTEGDYERNGLIGAMGNKTQWYGYAQRINKHIAAIDEVLMNAVNEGIIVSGEQTVKDMSLTTSCVLASGSFRQLQSVTGEALVGCFDYKGKTALYVVNYSFECAQDIGLQFDGAQSFKMIQNAETSCVEGDSLTLRMEAGEGILLVLE